MNLNKLIFTNNACYKAGKKITVKGIMVHSTGANNPTLKRYVGPDDGKLGKNAYNNHWNMPMDRQVCVHGFIGKLADGSVATYQTLPWDMRGWHGGSGPKGCVNDTHIGFEICEDGLTDAAYFNAVYKEAAELCAYLCEQYKLDPMKDGVIIGHYEGAARGIATNHGDPKNWFPKHGKSMDTFRAYVKELLDAATKPAAKPVQPTPTPAKPTTPTGATDEVIWKFLTGKGLNACAVAGIMGNLFAESGLAPTNLQNAFEKKLNYTDATYTAAVDSGKYTNFAKDGAGYGLAQWTYHTRKQALLDFVKKAGASIGDLTAQLNFLWSELQGYSGVMSTLKTASTVQTASDVVLLQYERPADTSAAVRTKRASYGQGYYNKFASKPATVPPTTPVFTPYTVRVTGSPLNIRKGAGTNYAATGSIKDKGVYTIVAEADGPGAKKWGKLKSGAGWISLDYTKKI
jgi:hypothetical protein